MKKLLILDVCDTIYPVNTTMGFIDFCISSKSWFLFSIFRKTLLGKAINVLVYKLFGVDVIRNIAISYLKGFHQKELVKKSAEYIDSLDFIEQIKVEVDKRKEDGWDIVLASASLQPIVEYICKKHQFSEYFATELAFDSEEVCKGSISKDALNKKDEYVEGLSSNYQKVIFITDNKGDANCIRHVDEFIAVVPRRNPADVEFWKKLPINRIIEL